MTWRCVLLASSLALALPGLAVAQPADLPLPPAATSEYPPGVTVIKADTGSVYADARGLTLYGMDMRTLVRWAPDPAQYCMDDCIADWEPLLAPAGSKVNIVYPQGLRPAVPEGFVQPEKAPDWTVIAGPQGPQWVYKGWHMVFTRKGDARGSTRFDGAQNFTWNTLKFVPPVPRIEAPATVGTVLVGGEYALADKNGRVLFTGKCKRDCDGWVPLAGGMASQGKGQWSIGRDGDTPQWLYHGKPVYVSQEADPVAVPASAQILRP